MSKIPSKRASAPKVARKTAKTKAGRVKTASKVPAPNGYCWCGCGGAVHSKAGRPTAYFLPGHDRTAMTRVVDKYYGSTVQFLLAHGCKSPVKPAVPTQSS